MVIFRIKRKRQLSMVVAGMICLAGCTVLAPSLSAATHNTEQVIAWENDCKTIDGWHFNDDDPGMQSVVEESQPSIIRIQQEGDNTWGKAAYVVQDIDLDQTPILEVDVSMVEKGSAFKIAVAPLDWSEMLVVIRRSSADGVRKGNIKNAVRRAMNKKEWKGPVSFNIVVIIEGKGKATFFDKFTIRSR